LRLYKSYTNVVNVSYLMVYNITRFTNNNWYFLKWWIRNSNKNRDDFILDKYDDDEFPF